MHAASALIAGGTLDALRGVLSGQFDHAFNPAGGLLHALRNRASGFCIYNDAAIAIAGALREHEAMREGRFRHLPVVRNGRMVGIMIEAT